MKQRCLFIGGYADGEWREVDTEWPALEIQEEPALPFIDITKIGKFDDTYELKRHLYKRMSWRSDHRKRFIYFHSELNEGDILDMLLRGYKRA